MVEFSCRHCATKYKVREALCGRTAECKTCGRRFTVPYASPVVRLGEEDLAGAASDEETDSNALANDETKVGEVIAATTAQPQSPAAKAPLISPIVSTLVTTEAPLELSQLPPERPASSRSGYGGPRRSRARRGEPADAALLPMPDAVSQLWLPLGLAVVCLGLSAYLILDSILQGPGKTAGLVLIAFGVAGLLVIAYRLTLKSLESSAHTFDIHFSDAIALQTVGCLSVPVLLGVFGLVQGGLIGTAIGVGIGAVLCPLLITLVFQLPIGKGMQSGLIASVAFAIGYACSALLVAGVANVMFTVWSVDLPWKVHLDPNQLAAAEAEKNAVAPTPAKPSPIAVSSATQPAAGVVAAPVVPVVETQAVAAAKPADTPAVPVEPVKETKPSTPAASLVPSQNAAPAPSAAVPPVVSNAAPPAASAVPVPSAAVPPAAVAPAAAPKLIDANLTVLTDAASDIAAGQYAKAVTKMTDLQKILPKNYGRLTDPVWIDSLHIQAVAQMKLGQPGKAAPAMVRAFESGQTNRSMVINSAVCDILNKTNVMRAVKNLQAYAATHPDDEQAINLWGVALDTFARREKGVKIDKLADDFVAANTLLERTRPGMHHWGTAWVGGGEWSRIQSDKSQATSEINFAQRELRDANVRLDNANRTYQQANVVIIGRPISDYERDVIDSRKRAASREIDNAKRAVESAKVRLEQAQQQLPRPTWALTVEPVDPELLSH